MRQNCFSSPSRCVCQLSKPCRFPADVSIRAWLVPDKGGFTLADCGQGLHMKITEKGKKELWALGLHLDGTGWARGSGLGAEAAGWGQGLSPTWGCRSQTNPEWGCRISLGHTDPAWGCRISQGHTDPAWGCRASQGHSDPAWDAPAALQPLWFRVPGSQTLHCKNAEQFVAGAGRGLSGGSTLQKEQRQRLQHR